jgi:hypothetical protein
MPKKVSKIIARIPTKRPTIKRLGDISLGSENDGKAGIDGGTQLNPKTLDRFARKSS